jgi:putative tryptophan/tyrosine transport system substrate-binding protein
MGAAESPPTQPPLRLSRRAFARRLTGLGASALGLVLVDGCMPRLSSTAQSVRIPRIAYLTSESSSNSVQTPRNLALVQGLRDVGYVEGQTIALDWRLGGDRPDVPLQTLAEELVALPVQVIVTSLTPPLVAAAQATHSVPIVSCLPHRSLQDLGLIESIAHPGGNVTGIEGKDEVYGKLVELLKSMVPSLARVAYLRNPSTPGTARPMGFSQAAADQLGLQLIEVQVRTAEEVGAAFAAALNAGVDGLVVAADSAFDNVNPDSPMFALPLALRLPTIYSQVDGWVPNGGLMAYSPDVVATHRRAATYVDKILKGAHPADLPVEQAESFDFAINLKTMQALGLTIPPEVAQQVTTWIQ